MPGDAYLCEPRICLTWRDHYGAASVGQMQLLAISSCLGTDGLVIEPTTSSMLRGSVFHCAMLSRQFARVV